MEINVSVLLAILGFALSAATFFIGRSSAAKNVGMLDGELKADIKHIKNTQEEMKTDIKAYRMNYTELCTELEKIKGRVSKLEAIVKMYHKEEAI